MSDDTEMPTRIWAGDFDAQGFGHCVDGMQGGLYEEYVRVRSSPSDVKALIVSYGDARVNASNSSREKWTQDSARMDKAFDALVSSFDALSSKNEEQALVIRELVETLQSIGLKLVSEAAIASRPGQMESLEALSDMAFAAARAAIARAKLP